MERNFKKTTLKVLTICYPGSSFDKKYEIFSLNKLNSAALYKSILYTNIDANKIKLTWQTYFFRILTLTGKASTYYLDVCDIHV